MSRDASGCPGVRSGVCWPPRSTASTGAASAFTDGRVRLAIATNATVGILAKGYPLTEVSEIRQDRVVRLQLYDVTPRKIVITGTETEEIVLEASADGLCKSLGRIRR